MLVKTFAILNIIGIILNYIYPIGFFVNYSSLSLIIIILSLTGDSAYAAEIAIIGSILTLSAQSFSANSRNLVFNKSLQKHLNIILQFIFSEYLCQIKTGIPMSQLEVIRPKDLGLKNGLFNEIDNNSFNYFTI